MRIAYKAGDEEKPYHQLQKCAQNSADQLVASCDFLPFEGFRAKCEEPHRGFEGLCQLPELENCWGCKEEELEVLDLKLLHMESF